MGIFNKSQKITSEGVYENSIKPNLHRKDGNIHVCLVTSFSKFGNQSFSFENKYSTQIDNIVTNMQNDGYEIVDIKLNSVGNQGMSNSATQFHTLIEYK